MSSTNFFALNVLPIELVNSLSKLLGIETDAQEQFEQAIPDLIKYRSANLVDELNRRLAEFHGRAYVPISTRFQVPAFSELPPFTYHDMVQFSQQYKVAEYKKYAFPSTQPITEIHKEFGHLSYPTNNNRAKYAAKVLHQSNYDPLIALMIRKYPRLERLLLYFTIAAKFSDFDNSFVIAPLSLLAETTSGGGVRLRDLDERLLPVNAHQHANTLRPLFEFVQNQFNPQPFQQHLDLQAAQMKLLMYPTLAAVAQDLQNIPLLSMMLAVIRRLTTNVLEVQLKVVLGRRRKVVSGVEQAIYQLSRADGARLIDAYHALSAHDGTSDFPYQQYGYVNEGQFSNDLRAVYDKFHATHPTINREEISLSSILLEETPVDEIRERVLTFHLDSIDPLQIYNMITHKIDAFFHQGSQYYEAGDFNIVVIVGVTVITNNNLNGTNPDLHSLLAQYLRHLKAHSNDKRVLRLTKEMQTVPVPYTGGKYNCVMEAFLTLTLMAPNPTVWKTLSYAERRERLVTRIQLLSEALETSEYDIGAEHTLFEWLKMLLSTEHVYESGRECCGSVMLCLFVGPGRPPLVPMTMIRWNVEEQRLDFLFPEKEGMCFSALEYGEAEPLLVYHLGHVFPSTLGVVRSSVMAPRAQHDSIRTLLRAGASEEFFITPVDVSNLRKIMNRKEAKRMVTVERQQREGATLNPLGQYFGVAVPLYEKDVLGYDFETDVCAECSAKDGKDIQHVYTACVGFGKEAEQCFTFRGKECPLAVEKGAIQLMIEFLETKLGFYSQVHDRRPPCKILKREFSAFNGGNFDVYFLFRYFLAYPLKYHVELVKMGSTIISMNVGNWSFTDFNRIYPGRSLDACFEGFRTSVKEEDRGQLSFYETAQKWPVFPYKLIHKCDLDQFVSIETLGSDENIWGGKNLSKKLVKPEWSSMSKSQQNAAWWGENISVDGYHRDHLERYCAADVQILMFCIEVHYTILCRGTINGREYDLGNGITAASISLSLLRQAYLTKPLQPAPPQFELANLRRRMKDGTTQNVYLQEVITEALMGGMVEVFEHEGKKVHYMDVNSMYPYWMTKSLSPSKFLEYLNWQARPKKLGPFKSQQEWRDRCEPLNPIWLYHASVRNPTGKSSLMCRYEKKNFCPTFIPSAYLDPGIMGDTNEVLHFRYGCELNVCLELGECEVVLYGVIKFEGDTTLQEFNKDLYTRRLASPNKMFKDFWKLMMNSLFGKFGQKPKAETHLLQNLLDLDSVSNEENVLSSIEGLSVPLYGIQDGKRSNEYFVCETIPLNKEGLISHVFRAGLITASARAHLLRLKYEVEAVGARVLYCDTDSLFVADFDETRADVQEFKLRNMDEKELGKLKIECTLEDLRILRKKFYVGYVGKKLRADGTVEQEEEEIIKCKGCRQHIVKEKWQDLFDLGEKYKRLGVENGVGFSKSLHYGITRNDEHDEKVLTYGNLGRQPPNAEGKLLPWPTLESFSAHLAEMRKAGAMDARELIFRDGS